jgi:hypothetical protein
MTKKLKPSEDLSLFEYEPHEDEVPDQELWEIFYAIGRKPEDIGDPIFKKKYLEYLETHQK